MSKLEKRAKALAHKIDGMDAAYYGVATILITQALKQTRAEAIEDCAVEAEGWLCRNPKGEVIATGRPIADIIRELKESKDG